MEIPQQMSEQYQKAKEIIENSEDIKIYSHIDCDGICSGAILSTILDRQNKEHDIEFVNLDVLDDIDLDHGPEDNYPGPPPPIKRPRL